MNINAFLTCLGYYGFTTGAAYSLEGAYSLSSGYWSGSTGLVFNQLYSSGSHFTNGQIYAPTLPLLNVYPNNIINNNYLTGKNGLRVGYIHTGNFSLLLDIEYSGCLRPTTQRGMVLVSTASSPANLNSGFVVGINEGNRLYFKTSGYQTTLDRELGTRDFVYVSLASQQFATIGIVSLDNNAFYKKSISMPSGVLNSEDLYVGNMVSYKANDMWTGFSGKLNQAVLFNDTLVDTDIVTCANCCLATGYNTGASTYSIIQNVITGMTFSGITGYAQTGVTNLTGQVINNDGSATNIISPSGMLGQFQTGQVVVPLFSGFTGQGYRTSTVFQFDMVALASFSKFSVYFDQMLSSGDSIEVYTYPQSNPNIGKLLNGLNWPTDTGIIQLIGNGLNETMGIDYVVSRNMISGFDVNDVLSYDVIPNYPVVTAYSGYWSGGAYTYVSGVGNWPPAPQYFEDPNFSGMVLITGLTGVSVANPFWPAFGYQLHMNGQKLISGMHFSVTPSGASGFVVYLSGNKLPGLNIYGIYDPTGGGPIGVSSVDDNELAFIPEFSGFLQAVINVTGNGYSFGQFTGFGEQVWVNGLRMLRGQDYNKTIPCSFTTGQFSPPALDFVLYDSNAGNDDLWNLNTPPIVMILTGLINTTAVHSGVLININGYPTNGPVLESMVSVLTGSALFAPFVPDYPQFRPTGLAYTNMGLYTTSYNWSSGFQALRYHNGNVIGPWTVVGPWGGLNNS